MLHPEWETRMSKSAVFVLWHFPGILLHHKAIVVTLYFQDEGKEVENEAVAITREGREIM